MPQKATKRFLWPFGGSGSGHHVAGDDGRHDSIESEATVAGTSTSPTAGRKSLDSGTTVGSRQHYFQPSNTFRPGKCERCLEKIWTFANNTVKCKHCNVICHHRCVADFPANCPGFDRSGRSVGGHHSHHGSAVNSMPAFDPNAPFQPDKMFGRSLIEQARSEDASVPWIVRAAIGFIEEQGLTMEGVYRKSGSTMDIRAIQMNVTQISVATNGKFAGTPPIASADADVTSVTSVLKQYFRELPDPLLTFETYHLWVQAAGIGSDEEKVRVYRTISDSMPHEHSETLKYLMLHLKRIAEYQQNNKMTPNNLSVVFAPNILHMPKSNVFEEMKNMGGINQTVRFLIQHANDIWGDQHYAQYSGRKDSQDNGQDASSPSSPAVGSRVEPMPIASPAGAAEQEDLNMSHSMPSSPAFLENAGGAQHSGRQQHVAHDMSERFMASHHHSP
ncbi:Rho-type gtpase-activating protein, partial [Linderina pennispora]